MEAGVGVVNTLQIPPHLDTTIPTKRESYFNRLPGAWLWMERNGIPLLHRLGRFPRKPWGKR